MEEGLLHTVASSCPGTPLGVRVGALSPKVAQLVSMQDFSKDFKKDMDTFAHFVQYWKVAGDID